MGGHGHDGAGAVASQNIIGNPDRYFIAGEPVNDVSAGKNAVFFLFGGKPFDISKAAGPGDIGFDFCFFIGGGNFSHQRMFRR